MDQSKLDSVEREIQFALQQYPVLFNSDGWEDLGLKNDIHGYKKVHEGVVYIKGHGIVNYPASQISDFLWDFTNRPKYEDQIESIEVLHKTDNVQVDWTSSSMPWPVSNRDGIAGNKRIVNGDDILIVSRSVDIGIPEKEGYVRANVHIKVYDLKDIEGIATEFNFLMGGDPKGDFPVWLINQLSGEYAFIAGKIAKAISNS